MVRAYRELKSPNGQICWDNIEFFAILKWPKPKNDVWKKMMSVQSSFATKKPLKIRRCEKCGLISFRTNALSDPELRACRTEFVQAVKEALPQLSEEQRQAVELLFIKDTPLLEAAKQANCSAEALRNRLRRGLKQLCQLLNHFKP